MGSDRFSIEHKLGRNSQKFTFHCIYKRKIKKRYSGRLIDEIEGRIFEEIVFEAKMGAFRFEVKSKALLLGAKGFGWGYALEDGSKRE